MVAYTASRGENFYWNMSSVFVNMGFALGASPPPHSETPRRGWALLHCFCMKTTSLWLSMNESTTCATFCAEQRDSGRTKVPPNFVCVTVGGSYSFVGRFHSFATCSCGSMYWRIGGFTLSSSTSMAGIARSKLDLPVWWRRGNRLGISLALCAAVTGKGLLVSRRAVGKCSRVPRDLAIRGQRWCQCVSPIVNSSSEHRFFHHHSSIIMCK